MRARARARSSFAPLFGSRASLAPWAPALTARATAGRRTGARLGVLMPAYAYCAWRSLGALRAGGRSRAWALGWLVASALTLLPSPLIEPRYLTVPILLLHANANERSWRSLALSALFAVAVNALTIYVFLMRPFTWPDGSIARFMW